MTMYRVEPSVAICFCQSCIYWEAQDLDPAYMLYRSFGWSALTENVLEECLNPYSQSNSLEN